MKHLPATLILPLLATLGAILMGGLGFILLNNTNGTSATVAFARPLEQLSYDLGLSLPLPFAGSRPVPQDVCIVYMTDGAARRLQQPFRVWSRKLHARLI